jgi:amino acid adenylation domain-containing protein
MPGCADLEAFWQNLVHGVPMIRQFEPGELEHAQASRDPENAANYVRARSVLDGVDLFDAAFFGIYPKEAEVMDPQHRLFLECAWEALESAGYDPDAYPGLIGLYGGLSLNSYLLYNLSSRPGFAEQMAATYPVGSYETLFGNDKDFLTTRVAYKLNLRGPCVTLQSACSTSLVAIVHAYYSLLTYQCDMALAGGVSITFPQKRDYLYRPDSMLSKDGTCRTFDAEATGTVFGSGLGIVVLKRLADALADGDQIRAVIKGAAMNNDGAMRIGYAAPGVDGQAEVIALAHASAGITADAVSYVEAHGTGTPLGDPIEVAALTQAFRRSTAARAFCALASAKTNVGHLDMAAGVTGFIKIVLQLERECIPPLLHFKKPNPQIDFSSSPFYPVAQLTDWKRGAQPRRAGVSAFGVGGTNAHVILEEAPLLPPAPPSRPLQLILLSARTPAALDCATNNLASHLERHPELTLADVAFTLQKGRRAFGHRRALVCRDATEATALLRSMEARRVFNRHHDERRPAVAFLFPGQGAQSVDMGRELYETEAVFRAEIDRCAIILQRHLGLDIRRVLYPDASERVEAEKKINETWITQPAIFVTEFALAKLWLAWGVKPAVLIGHSIGEYVCAVLAETFTLEDALSLLSVRARLMQALPAGSMLAVRLGADQLQPLLPSGVSLAALNSPNLCTVSGPTEILQKFSADLDARKIATKFLQTSHAFHSEMMDPMLPEFAAAAEKTPSQPPRIRWISTCTGQELTAQEITNAAYWPRQIRQTVRFCSALERLITDPQHILLEVGPGQTLTQLAHQHPAKPADLSVISTLGSTGKSGRDLSAVLTALGQLWLAGVKPDWEGFYASEKRRRVSLPTYPFERKRYWIEPLAGSPANANQPLQVLAPITAPDANPAAMPVVSPACTAPEMSWSSTPMNTANLTTAANRKDRLIGELRKLIRDLSGLAESDLAATVTFMELGFDSLFLTQASQSVQKKFHVKVTFRQMLDDLCSIDALASHLDQKLPPEAFPAAVATVATPAAASAGAGAALLTPAQLSMPGAVTVAIPAAQGGLIERVVAQQMAIMQQQLELLRGTPLAASAAPAAAPLVVAPAAVAPALVTAAPPATKTSGPAAEGDLKRFGPFKGIAIGPKGGLTPKQEQALAELTARYNQRTARSKEYAQAHRAHFCDPRAAGNFRQQWKEMVYPIVCARSKGGKIWDIDGNEYVDVTLGFGANYFGHSPDFVVKAVEEQLHKGFEIGPQSPLAGDVAQMLCEMTGMERATFCNTGSEAVMAAMRVARTVTARDRIVYFTGDYHGIFDEVLAHAGMVDGRPGALPIAPGIPPLPNMMVLEYGNPASLDTIRAHAGEIAAAIVEPVQSRHPDFQPREFLHALRQLTQEKDIALIFDEVVTGFRAALGGAQEYFGVRADLATYGKVIGGGMPIGVLAGSRRFMDALDGGMWQFGDASYPEVGVTFFAGTFVRHPLAMAAAHATLKHLQQAGPDLQRQTTEKTARFARRLNDFFASVEVPIRLQTFSSVFYYDFHPDLRYASLLFYFLRDRGVHIWEGRVGQICTAHTDEELNHVFDAFKASVEEMQAGGFLPASEGHAAVPSTPEPAALPASPLRVPLTEAQHEIWIAAQMGEDANCAYNESCSVHLQGVLQVEKFQQAVQQLVGRHDALRCRFSPLGDYQEFTSEVQVELPVRDLSGLSDSQRAQQIQAMIAADMAMPFDLVNGPVFRVQLLKLGAEDHQFVFTTHHAVCDGWSFGVVFHELAQLYSGLAESRPGDLAPAMQFRDYAEWCRQQQGSPEVREAERFWVQKFEGTTVPALDLPCDRPRPALKSYNGSLAVRRCDPQVFRDLKTASGKMGNTLFGTLFSAFCVLLHRLSGQDDIVVGIPAAGQTMVASNDLLGHCLNFLPTRTTINGEQSFLDFAARVKKDVLDAYDHQNYTYGTLIQKLKLPRDASRLPLLSVMFNIDKRGFDKLGFTGLKASVATNPKEYVNFDLFLNLVQGDNELDFECEFNTDLFDRETVMRWLGHFETVMRALARNAKLALENIPLNSPAEEHQLLVEFNQTAADFARERTLHQLFEEQACRTPEKIAVQCGEESVTYRELDLASSRLANHLRGMGVKVGDLVGLCAERSVEMVVGLIGILKSGAAYVPMDPAFPGSRLACMIEDSEMPVIVTQSKLASRLPPHSAKVVFLDSNAGFSSDSISGPWAQPEDPAYVIFTSGSTGRPKGVRIPHRAVINFLSSMRRQPGISPDDVLLSVTTLSFDIAGLEVYLPLTAGASLVVATHEVVADGNKLRREMESRPITIMQATPVTWTMLIEAGWRGSPHLKILCGGEALSKELADQLLSRCGSLWNMYGPTETTIWSTVCQVRDIQNGLSIGRPIDNTQVYIVDRKLQAVPIGVPGELLIGGDGVALGYHKRPDLTTEKFIPDPFTRKAAARLYRTGDLVRCRRDGSLEFFGRLDQQVKLRGFRIELGEIEAVLRTHPGVRDCVVVLREDVPGQKRLVGYVDLKLASDASAAAPKSWNPGNGLEQLPRLLREIAQSELPDYMVPAAVVVLDNLPRTPNGKIARQALPIPDFKTGGAEREFVGPRNEMEKKLADIWMQVLGLERVSVLDNFFELGGDSLLSFRVANRASNIGLPLTPRLFFQYRTIADLVKAVENEGESASVRASTSAITRASRDAHRRKLPTNHLT